MSPFGPDQPGVDRLMQHGLPSQYSADQGDLLLEAERLRDEGIARVTAASDERDIAAVDHWIGNLNTAGGDWSANDLREYLTRYEPEVMEAKPQLVGARVRAAAMRKQMVKVGYTPSTLPSTHAHPIAVWRGVA